MQWASLLKEACANLWAYRSQSILSLLSLIAGAVAIFCMLALGESAKRTAYAQLGSLGANTFSVTLSAAQNTRPLSIADSQAILQSLPEGLEGFAYTLVPQNVSFQGHRVRASVIASSPQIANIFEIPFMPSDTHARVCFVGEQLAATLPDPVEGRSLLIGDVACEIIGVLPNKPDHPFFDASIAKMVWIPLKALERFEQPNSVQTLFFRHTMPYREAQALSAQRLDAYQAPTKRQWRNLETFQAGFMAQYFLLKKSLSIVAWVTLSVGALNLLNILLICLRARYHEVGIRICLGASPTDLLALFLLESVVLCGLSAGIGIVISQIFFFCVAQQLHWAFFFDFNALWITLLSMLLLGGAVGGIPAWKAAKLKPVALLNT